VDLEGKKNLLGTAMSLMRDLNNIIQDAEMEGDNDVRTAERIQIRMALDNALDLLPRLDDLSNITLVPDPHVFFEVLCMNIKNNLLSFQGWLTKTENLKLNLLKKRVENLKNNYLPNIDEIFLVEGRINKLQDDKLSSKVGCFKIFENLTNERMNPAFLALVKNRTNGKLAGICNDNGEEFLWDKDREKHIFDTYEKLYKKIDTPLNDNIIEEFLGPDVLNSDLVRNSKLSPEESAWLDRPLTLAELDISANKGKLCSAPGSDGFSNYLIKKIWPYIRIPFFNYTTHCYNLGILMPNFRSATIRLIPKKR
jgi:hypothetical protein